MGSKVHADGTVRFYPGNTVIAHLDPQQPLHGRLLGFCQRLAQLGFGEKMTFLPPASYHVTLICGVDDRLRGLHGWPRDLPINAPLALCHSFFADRLRTFDLCERPPYRLRASAFKPGGSDLVLDLEAISGTEEHRLSRLRRDLAELLGLCAPTFALHFTLGYLVKWLTPEEEHGLRLEQLAFLERLRREHLVVELGLPEYCHFQNMFSFDRQFYLGVNDDVN
ncbi:DUF1868 domain-containing protein [Deinococcus sp.]|uniref:DUF1868 domain-containing protein n=1 Tax=Deinococcus sp. TaxID=47478 RepID=UPI0025E1F839|nr:DUF1868 domain-containing protein [Deinococcus sp.]